MAEITPQDLIDARPKGNYQGVHPFKTVAEFINISGMILGEAAEKSRECRKLFLDLLLTPEFHEMKGIERAEAVGVSLPTLQKWMIQVPDEYLAEALKVQREKSARRSLEVDAALYREATRDEGDAKHKELYYRRIEGWVPKQDMELSRGRDKELDGKANFDLLKELFKGLSPEEKRSLIGEVPQGAIELNSGAIDEALEGGGGGG